MTTTEALDLALGLKESGCELSHTEQALVILAEQYLEMAEEIATERGMPPAQKI